MQSELKRKEGDAVEDVHKEHRLRMRARYREHGLENFEPHEVLELLLYYAIPRRDVNAEGHRLMERFGTLEQVLNAKPEELMKVEGIGEQSATLLALTGDVNRYIQTRIENKPVRITNYQQAQEHCRRLLGACREERFYAVCLNAQDELLCSAMVGKGGLSEVQVHPRMLADVVLRHNAHTVVLCHNHPGGSLEPSLADIETTRQLEALLNSIEVALADHIIVAGGKALSMSRAGYYTRGAQAKEAQAADSSDRVLPFRGERPKK